MPATKQRVENNRRKAVCLTCGRPIPAFQGQRVDTATGELRGYRHPACPNPKSERRDPHKLGKHVLRSTKRGGPNQRSCAVCGCKYVEVWDAAHGEWVQPPLYGHDLLGGARPPEPALVNLPLFAS